MRICATPRLRLTYICAGLISITSLQAAVTVTNSDQASLNDINADTYSYTVQQTNSTLVIGFYIDANESVTGVTFDGVAADGFFSNSRMTIAYWDNPNTGSGNLDILGIPGGFGGTDVHLGVYELSGVDLTTVNSSTGGSITTTTDNEFVVSFAGSNGDAGDHSPTSTSIIDSGLFSRNGSNLPGGSTNGGGSMGGGYGFAGLAGSQDVSFVQGDTVSYSFQAVPEPSAISLIGLGSLLLLRRRR